MAHSRKTKKKDKVQELDLTEHAQRLRGIPGSPAEMLRTLLIWMAAGVVFMALAWLTLRR